ncbi:MAG: HAD-IIA family hydrolase [Ruminococcaceae bacterium]|nr:HAD-IIA family hydrolase [Oscillospiraceae bacterium]
MLSEKRLFLLDMDGTIYLDDDLFDGTLDFLEYVREIGGKYQFLTNNSSRSVEAYVQKMARLGIETTAEDFLTSVDALCVYLKKHGFSGKKLYGFGTQSFCRQLADHGFRVYRELRDDIDALVCGFDTELTFQKLEDACILLGRGVDFIAANPDWLCPTSYGFVPDCGSVCQMLTRATGRKPTFIGKPQPEMAFLAMEKCGFSREQTILLGDRIYTDIACGVNAGIDTVLLLSGESTLQDIDKNNEKPTYVYDNIRIFLTELWRETV